MATVTGSGEILRVIDRLRRLIRRFDGDDADAGHLRDLLHQAASHRRAEVQSVFDELLYIMSPDQLERLRRIGVELPPEYRALLPRDKRGARGGEDGQE